jgi:hypothetical protein
MGTRSIIGVMHGDNCKFVYCHWDGYLEHNGRILQEHYDSARANHLVALGDISSLQKNIAIPDGVEHSFEKPADDITVFYGRDRGTAGVEFRSVNSFKRFLEHVSDYSAEFYYIMQDGVWYCGAVYGPLKYKLMPLAEAIAVQENQEESV